MSAVDEVSPPLDNTSVRTPHHDPPPTASHICVDMPRYLSSDDEEPLEDKTAALSLKSKRTERMQRKKAKQDRKRDAIINITKLPTEILLECLKALQPSDVLRFAKVNRRFRELVHVNSKILGDAIITQRYSILSQCFPTPRLLSEIDPSIQSLLVEPSRQASLSIHHKPYQHVQSPNPHLICSCITCVLTWNNLSLVLDFAHWQDNLDRGVPIPIMPRGKSTEWNDWLIWRNAKMAEAALENSLWHARILELHLDSTRRAIRRHAKNKGNKRKHVDMTDAEAAAGTDAFLAKAGPLGLEFPYQRDEYYML